jgi:hypothetical protein
LFFWPTGRDDPWVRFAPYSELDGEPNVIVDGAGTTNTLITLSHWPGSTVPVPLRADLSAEIAIRYLEQPDHHVAAELVSNNHFDEDGLLGVYALVDPEAALPVKDLVADVARAGDFGCSRTRHAARVAFAISTLVDPAASPLDPSVFAGEYPEMAARLYCELLPRVPDLLSEIDRFRALWADEDAHLDASNAAFARNDVSLAEHAELDLAIVTLPTMDARFVHRFTQRRRAGLHPMSVHNRTDMMRIAYICDRYYSVELRYETVVQFVSRPLLPRPDLSLLADRLNELEASSGKWNFEGVGGLTPKLHLLEADESAIEPAAFIAELVTFLADAEPAWDPWTEKGFR